MIRFKQPCKIKNKDKKIIYFKGLLFIGRRSICVTSRAYVKISDWLLFPIHIHATCRQSVKTCMTRF